MSESVRQIAARRDSSMPNRATTVVLGPTIVDGLVRAVGPGADIEVAIGWGGTGVWVGARVSVGAGKDTGVSSSADSRVTGGEGITCPAEGRFDMSVNIQINRTQISRLATPAKLNMTFS